MTALVVLPGLDGLANLSLAFVESTRPFFDYVVVISYPPDETLGYAELDAFVRNFLPKKTPYILLGQSFSGPVAISIAASRPVGLFGLALSTTFSQNPIPWLEPLASFAHLVPIHLMPRTLLSRWLLGRWATPHLQSSLQNALCAVKSSVLRSRIVSALRANMSARLSTIAVPTLYLRASEDRLLPRTVETHIFADIQQVKMVDIVGPHLLLQCAPDACAQAVVDFATRLNGCGSVYYTGNSTDCSQCQ